jgi:hypothetical protein
MEFKKGHAGDLRLSCVQTHRVDAMALKCSINLSKVKYPEPVETILFHRTVQGSMLAEFSAIKTSNKKG